MLLFGYEAVVTLAAPSLHVSFGEAIALPSFTPRLVLELLLLSLLFSSLVCSAMAVRYHNHAGFISGMPGGSEARQRWAPAGRAYVRRARRSAGFMPVSVRRLKPTSCCESKSHTWKKIKAALGRFNFCTGMTTRQN